MLRIAQDFKLAFRKRKVEDKLGSGYYRGQSSRGVKWWTKEERRTKETRLEVLQEELTSCWLMLRRARGRSSREPLTLPFLPSLQLWKVGKEATDHIKVLWIHLFPNSYLPPSSYILMRVFSESPQKPVWKLTPGTVPVCFRVEIVLNDQMLWWKQIACVGIKGFR